MPKEFSEKPTSLFQQKVYKAVRKIPIGETLTYQEVARLIDRPKAWRAVGNALNKNTDRKIPCHRVIKSDGSLGGYNTGVDKKAFLLNRERVKMDENVKKGVFLWNGI